MKSYDSSKKESYINDAWLNYLRSYKFHLGVKNNSYQFGHITETAAHFSGQILKR